MGVYLRGNSWYIDFYEDGKRYTERVGEVRRDVPGPLAQTSPHHVG
jgi:hypothetical protein